MAYSYVLLLWRARLRDKLLSPRGSTFNELSSALAAACFMHIYSEWLNDGCNPSTTTTNTSPSPDWPVLLVLSSADPMHREKTKELHPHRLMFSIGQPRGESADDEFVSNVRGKCPFGLNGDAKGVPIGFETSE